MSRPFTGSWSFNNMCQYIDGEAWSVDKNLKTVWVGTEKMVKEFFDTGELPDNLSPDHKRFLLNIRSIPPM